MRILYATDGSEGALAAGRFLASLPLHSNTHIHIVTIVDEGCDDTGKEPLETARAALGAFPGQITTAVGSADSTSEIVAALLTSAEYRDSRLIVVGARGKSTITRILLGSVAEGLARQADVPVLIARDVKLPLQEVLVGVDSSRYSRDAACWVSSYLPLPQDCSLRLVRVVPSPRLAMYMPVGTALPDPLLTGTYEQDWEEMGLYGQKMAHQEMEALACELGDKKGKESESKRWIIVETPVGHPVTELLRSAEHNDTGLVVVGSRNLSSLSRFLLGSVSADIIHHAPCSVLVFRHPRPADEGQPT